MADEDPRDPNEAIDEMRDKLGEGEDLDEDEQRFLESERVQLEPEEGTGTPVA